jgi:translation initiation factor IF-3
MRPPRSVFQLAFPKNRILPRFLPAPLLPVRSSLDHNLSPPNLSSYSKKHAVQPAKPSKLYDEDIPHVEVNYIDEAGTFQGLRSVREILSSIDRATHRLVCINPNTTNETLIVKQISKENIILYDKKSRELAKERRKKKKMQVVKTVEVSWAIDPRDLEHKVRKVKELLEKGFRVEITVGTKKGMAKQTLERMDELLEDIRQECEVVGREWKEAEGDIGKMLTMYWEVVGVSDGSEVGKQEETDNEVKEEEAGNGAKEEEGNEKTEEEVP